MYVLKTSGGMGATPPWLALGGIPDQPIQAGQRQPCRRAHGVGTPALSLRGSDGRLLQNPPRLAQPVFVGGVL